MRLFEPYRVAAPHGVALSSQEVPSDAEFERSAIYNEVIRPTGTFHSIFAQQRGPTQFFLNLCRAKRRPFDAGETATVQRLLPHISTAVEFRRRLRVAENGHAGLARLLDRLASGVILTDARSRLCFANRRALMLAEEGDGLRFTADGLAGAAPGATHVLREAVALTSADKSSTSRRLQLSRPSRLPLLLSLMAVWRLGAAVPGMPTPTVAIFITEPDAPAAVDAVALADVLGLARRESEVVALLAEGDSLAEIAGKLGLTVGAVRQYLKRAFDKTGRHARRRSSPWRAGSSRQVTDHARQPATGGRLTGGRCYWSELPVLDVDDLVGARPARGGDLDGVALGLADEGAAIGEEIEILPSFTSASTSPTIWYFFFSSVSSSTSVTSRRT